LRLAVVSPFVDRQHGTERALAELLERLAFHHGCEIHLYSQRVEDLNLSLKRANDPHNAGRITWRKIPAVGGPHLVRFVYWILINTLFRFWDEKVNGLKFDVIFSPGINCLDADFVVVHALFHRLKELSAQDGSRAAQHGLLRRWHQSAYYGLLSALERRIYSNQAVALATVSERAKKLLTTYCHRRDIAVVPNAVDATEFSVDLRLRQRSAARDRRGLMESDFVVLLIGNDWRVKGLPCVMEAMQEIGGKSLHLLAVGSENPARYMEQARRLGVTERVEFEVSGQDALELYAAADVYVSPSLEDSFGLPVLEAMACGLPVITSSFAGVSELVSHEVDGFVMINPQEATELARVLKRLAADPNLRARIGEAAAIRAKGCNWEQNSATVHKLLDDLITKKYLGNDFSGARIG